MVVMRYFIDYMSGEDLCHAWINADSADEAEILFREENWDVERIIGIHL